MAKENYSLVCLGCNWNGHCQIQDSEGPSQDCQLIMAEETSNEEEEDD